jgi:hypothetical protein
MVRGIAWGIGKGLDGKEAGQQAIQQALNSLGSARPILAILLVSQEFEVTDVLSGIAGFLGTTPVWGFSTTLPLSKEGEQTRSVIVALLSGSELKARVHWMPGYVQDNARIVQQIRQLMTENEPKQNGYLIVADGVNGDATQICREFIGGEIPLAGGLAAGGIHSGKTFQFGGLQGGTGALSLAALSGRFRMGVGMGTGWQDIGISFQVDQAKGAWIQSLDGLPAAETIAKVFGYSARDWAFPPLTDLARLYCLGIETSPGNSIWEYRSPLHVEVDGSLRVNAPVPSGQTAHLLVGDPDACLDAARNAARQALQVLGKAKPLLALILIDHAWHYLFETRQSQIMAVIQPIIGETIMIGAYTFGQIGQISSESAPRLYNQFIQVIILGEYEA